jgi:hypothetical protein
MVFPELGIWQIILGLAVGALALVGGVFVSAMAYKWLKSGRQGYPGEDAIEEALLPIVRYGIMAAYRLSENVMDELGARLQGTDKAEIARFVYELIPDTIDVGGIAVPLSWVKTIIPEAKFAGLVQRAFDELVEFMETNSGKFEDKLRELLDIQGAARVMARIG